MLNFLFKVVFLARQKRECVFVRASTFMNPSKHKQRDHEQRSKTPKVPGKTSAGRGLYLWASTKSSPHFQKKPSPWFSYYCRSWSWSWNWGFSSHFPSGGKNCFLRGWMFFHDSLGGHRSTQKHAWAKRSLKTERFFRFLWISNLMDEACIQEPQSFSSSVHILSNNSSTLNLINVIPVDSDADKSWCQAAFVCIRISWAMSSSVLFGCRYQVVSDCINMHTHKQLHSQLPISSGLKWKMRSEIKSWKLLLGTYVCLESWDVNRFLFLDQP